jgi:glycine cleavage system H protein
MRFPTNYLYTIEHEWLNQQTDIFYAGITDFAQNELGDIVLIVIETIGQTIERGKIFGKINAVKMISDLFIPV